MEKLTQAQARVLDVIRARAESDKAPPTYRELQAELGFRSTGSVRDHLRALEHKGFLVLGEGRFRSTRLVRETTVAARIPILGHIVAGVPTPAQEALEGFVEVPSQWIRGDAFALHVVGDSMKDAGILEGDTAILRRDLEPKAGQIVCATVNGETTLKVLESRNDGVWLVPANAAYRPIRFAEDSSVQGVLLVSFRKYERSRGSSSTNRAVLARVAVGARSDDGAR